MRSTDKIPGKRAEASEADATDGFVLILEDEPIARLHLQRLLRNKTPYTVEAVGDAESAVRKAQEERIDILVADILMDGMDGITAAQQILARQDTVVVFVTGSTDPRTRERADKVGPADILTKPADTTRLISLIEDAVENRHGPHEQELQPDFLLDTLYDTAQIGMCVTDENRRFVRVNRAYCNTYGYKKSELLGQPFTMVLPEEEQEVGGEMHDRFIDGSVAEIPADWRVRRSDGEIRDVYVTAGRMFGSDGRPYKITTVADVTDRKRHERELEATVQEKEVLLKEVHHRVKNNLNTLSSLLSLQLEQYQGESRIAEVLAVSINRIKTMSSIYERLHQQDSPSGVELRDYLTALARDLVTTNPSNGTVDLEADMDRKEVDIDTGISAGLIVNELVTNSLKHAFFEGGVGTIHLHGKLSGESYVLEIRDTGRGIGEDFDLETSNSLGMQLIHAVSGQRGGAVTIENRESAHVRVELPLPSSASG